MEEGPDGLQLELSTASTFGYLGVIKVRNEFHARVAVDPWPAPQRTLPGKGCSTAREAAIRLARYRAAGSPALPPKKERRPRGKGKVCAAMHLILSFFLTYSQLRIAAAHCTGHFITAEDGEAL